MRTIHVLHVDDDPDDARLIRESLDADTLSVYDIQLAESLHEAKACAEHSDFDIVLLGLHLPDGEGWETIEVMTSILPRTPIVILTGLADDGFSEVAIQKGAEDYLEKGSITTLLLTRSIKYAIERSLLKYQLERLRQLERNEKELAVLDRLSPANTVAVTEKALGLLSLKESSPETFKKLSARLESILGDYMKHSVYKTDTNMSGDLQKLAVVFGMAHAGPKDLVEVYSDMIQTKLSPANIKASQAFLQEGRVLLLEMMGYLVNYYRRYALGHSSQEKHSTEQ